MGVRTATSQKSEIGEQSVDRIADQRRRLPARLHAVVVEGFGAIEAQVRCRLDQPLERQAVAARMRQKGQSTRSVDALARFSSPQWCPHGRLALPIGRKGCVAGFKPEGKHVNEAALEQAADLNPAPEGRHPLALSPPLNQPTAQGVIGLGAVVVGHRQVLQADRLGLTPQLLWTEAAITAGGVTVEIELGWATGGVNAGQNGAQRMGDGA